MFAVSNIAWSPEEDRDALLLLAEAGIASLEVAPGRIWPLGGDTPAESVGVGVKTLRDEGFAISGFQAILYGKPELRLFNDTTRAPLLAYLSRLAAVCGLAGGKYLVFGAPKNRWMPESLNPTEGQRIAVEFFRELGATAVANGVAFGIEANPAGYGCNFLTQIEEVVRLVQEVSSPGIHWHLDTGEMSMNSERLPDVIEENFSLVGSAHVSEPNLGDFSQPWPGHVLVASLLRDLEYRGPISLEMKRPADGLVGVRSAIDFLLATYA